MSQVLLAILAGATPEAAIVQPIAAAGVTPYTAAFFVASQPNSAMDMISRIPGFSFDEGDNVRGYGGAAGNVLIDGQRPATKSEGLEDSLRRIQAGQVERIDIIRGGAPGIDMQGKTVIANVILRKDQSGQWLFAVADIFYQDGRDAPAVRFEGTRKFGDRTFEWSALKFNFVDDGAGEGPRTRVSSTGVLQREGVSDETAGGGGYTLKAGVKAPFLGGRVALNAKMDHERYEWSLDDVVTFPTPAQLLVNDDQLRDGGAIVPKLARALGANAQLKIRHPDPTLDAMVPLSRVPTFIAWYQGTISHYPVGCMPYRPGHRYEWLAPAVFADVTDDLYVALAVAGAPQPAGRNYYRELERALAGFGGVKTLGSHNYYDEHEFWRTWNRPNYARVKRRTDPQNVLRDLYDKTCRASHGRA